MRRAIFMFALMSALIVAGCSDDDDEKATPTPPPAQATAAQATATAAQPTLVPSPTSAPTQAPTPTAAASLAGSWKGTWKNTNVTGEGTFTLQWIQSGSDLAGTIVVAGTPCLSNATVTGKVSGNTINFGVVQGLVNVAYTGTISGGTMSGTYQADANCANATGDWSATR